jgi:uncharacterized protein YqhQ
VFIVTLGDIVKCGVIAILVIILLGMIVYELIPKNKKGDKHE